MFTGIIRTICTISQVDASSDFIRYALAIESPWPDLETGASISIDGVCQTVVAIAPDQIWFEAIKETLERTTIKYLKKGERVNCERAARLGDEIGGHLLSGHVYGMATIKNILHPDNNCIVTLGCPPAWTKYLFSKGYIALNGASLTLVDVHVKEGLFTVHLIPETLKRTTFGLKKSGDLVNVELDSQTQIIVDTVERILDNKKVQTQLAPYRLVR